MLAVIKLVLGMVFVYASFHKIQDPAGFAKILYGYDLFPEVSINLLAICVPFIELTAGFFLIFGLYPRAAALVINLLLLFFIALIAFNLARGHQFDCGCFSSLETENQTLVNMVSLLRDIVLLGCGIYYLKKTAPPKPGPGITAS